MKDYNVTVSFYQGIEGQLMPEENMIWKGGPKKKAFVLNSAAGMAPFALLWLFCDGFFITMLTGMGVIEEILYFVIPFFAIHLFPVWIWLYNILKAGKRWKDTQYGITDKRIIICNTLSGGEYQSIDYTNVSNVHIQRGFVDKLCGVGDIILTLYFDTGEGCMGTAKLLDLDEPEKVLGILRQVIVEAQQKAREERQD